MSKIDKPFTPVFDDITQNPTLGAMAGLVFGIVWRYCQMKQEICFATVKTISKRSGVSAPTVSKYLKQLVKDGYLVNITPDVKGISHHYRLGDLADRYIKLEFGMEPPQDWADELDDLSKSLEPPLKNFRTTSKDFDTKIVSKIEDKSTNGEKKSPLPGGKTPPKTNGKKKGTDPRVQPLLKEFEKLVGYTLPNYGQEAKAAKAMLKNYKPAEILACWRYMQKNNDFWEDKHCGMASVNKQIGKWREGQNTNGGRTIQV